MDEVIFSSNISKTQQFARKLAKIIKPGDVLAFYGNLGSGKTTFIQELAKAIGIKKRIISPTFIIVRSYLLGDGNFYHIDLYRISSDNDLSGIGIDQIIKDKNSIIAIEWADKLGSFLPQKRYDLIFENMGEDKRKISIKKYE